MHNLRILLAVAAVALLLAAMPDDASANSQQHCKNQWNDSSASGSCTVNLSITWSSLSEKCRIIVSCTTAGGGLHHNDRKQWPNMVPHNINCNGVLRYVNC